jgi:hypothetical protein
MRVFRKGARKFDSATPVTNRRTRDGAIGLIVKISSFVVVPLFLLWQVGQPAVLIQYDYRGSNSGPRWKTACHFVSLTGWHQMAALNGECPVVTAVPINILEFLGVSR